MLHKDQVMQKYDFKNLFTPYFLEILAKNSVCAGKRSGNSINYSLFALEIGF
jgi:hypothetical protein